MIHYSAGVDIIAGNLMEINCVRPGGIPRINRLNNERLERKVIDFIEGVAQQIHRDAHTENRSENGSASMQGIVFERKGY